MLTASTKKGKKREMNLSAEDVSVESPKKRGGKKDKSKWSKLLCFQSNSADLESSIFAPDAARLLSNFASLDVCYNSTIFPSVEHAFQGMKYSFTSKPRLMEEFAVGGSIHSAADAKRAGGRKGMAERGVELDIDQWNANRIEIMRGLIHSKLERHQVIRDIVKSARMHGITLVHTSRSDLDWGAHVNEDRTGIKAGNNLLGEMYNTVEIEQFDG